MLLFGRFLSHYLGDSWLSSVVCLSLDCVYYAAIVGVLYHIMMLSHVLALLPPLLVYICIPHIQRWMWVFSFESLYVMVFDVC